MENFDQLVPYKWIKINNKYNRYIYKHFGLIDCIKITQYVE
jgi:hypothetical protein